jgi:signal transduction histidine kinase
VTGGAPTQPALDAAAVLEHLPDAVLVVDASGVVVAANAAGRSLGPAPLPGPVGARLDEALPAPAANALLGLIGAGFAGLSDHELLLPDGRRLGCALRPWQGGLTLLTLRDVSRPVQVDLDAQHARRLASMGRLAGALVNELQTPLSIILGRIELMAAQPADAVQERHLSTVLHHCMRMAGVVHNLQWFAAPQAPARQGFAAEPLLDGAVASLGRRLERVIVERAVVPDGLRGDGDPDQLERLVANLLCVAVDASPPRGLVRVEVAGAGAGVRFRVSHDGPPVPQALLDELRSPYAGLARPVDPTFGLGLAIAWAIAQDHGGSLHVENTAPHGVAFTATIPPATAAGRASAPSAGPLRILVVDDDQLLCDTVTWMLGDAGHAIVSVNDAEGALARLGRQPFDVVITDLRLPGMSGEALVQAVRERWPRLGERVLLTSGLLVSPPADVPYLQKPFTREQLLGALDALPLP